MAIHIQKPPARKNPHSQESAESKDLATTYSVPSVLPLVSLREGVVFPHTENVLVFGRQQSRAAIESAMATHQFIVVVGQKNGATENPKTKDLYRIGTLAQIERTLQHDGDIHTLIRGVQRVRISEFQHMEPFPVVSVEVLEERLKRTDTFEAELKHLANLFRKTVQSGKAVEFFNFVRLLSGTNSHELVDHVAATLEISTGEKQRLLEQLDVNKRVKAVIAHLSHEEHILSIEQKISDETKKQIDERMRENILRERMQAIQKELGELDEEAELDELEERLKAAKMPADIEKKVAKEITRLRQMSPMHAEYSYVLSWVEVMLDLPWSKRSRTRTSLKLAEKILNQHHYGLEKVKERVLEHLAVMKLQQAQHKSEPRRATSKVSLRTAAKLPTILCFVGPPGVGKTSIGRSIAESLGREFVKVSLGGVRDEAEIRGHRRTYVGAMPGRIIQAIQQAGTKNPVFMLDEIDKVGNDFRGDPSSALLEALDPEQNHAFSDHYLGEPFDLSEVMFIATANVLHTIPGPLRDRLEIIEYSGYTYDEKFHIAKQYLLEQATRGSGLKLKQLSISDSALERIIQEYTREAGVRTLKRELAKVARKAARMIAQDEVKTVKVSARTVEDYLGPVKFQGTLIETEDSVGLVNGLAWTSVGGELMQIEAALSEGKPGFTLTGQLGDVMKESAQAALTSLRSRAKSFDIDPAKFEKSHVHIHVPEGAVPKDGPSAGVAMTVALASVFTGRAIRRDVAMTGETTLRGRVLAIGGLKEKLIAAHRAGVKLALIPKDNVKDLVEVPAQVKKDIEIIPIEHVREALERVLVK